MNATFSACLMSGGKISCMRSRLVATCFCVLIVFFFACKKDNRENKVKSHVSIVGTWELRQATAAMNPLATNYAPGNGNILKFTDQNYEAYKNGQLVRRGSYAIVPDTTVETNVCLIFPDGNFQNRIDLADTAIVIKQFIQISNDTLSIIAGCYAIDAGHTAKYVRK
jgi:hypothetical protein